MDRLEVPRTRGDRPQVMARLMARSYNRLVSGKSFGEASGSKVPAGRHPGSSLSLIGVEGLKSHAFSRASLSETRGNPPSPTRRPRGPLRTYEIGVPTITTDARIRALAGVGRLRIWHSQRLRRRQRAKPSPSLKGASSRAACSSVITATPCAETGSLSMSRVVVSYPAIRGGTTSAKGSE